MSGNSYPWYSHHITFRTLTMDLSFELKTPMRIGAGKQKTVLSPIDLQVLRIKHENRITAFIPGSSLKGVFRTASENIATTANIPKICFMGDGCRSRLEDTIKLLHKNKAPIEEIVKKINEYCLICKIFGSGSYGSHIFFSDAYPPKDVEPEFGVKTGIAIDRRSGSVRRGALYTVEFVLPGARFNGNITFKNLPNYAIGLIVSVIKQMNGGIVRVGGFKSRGFGKVTVDVTKFSGEIFDGTDFVELSECEKIPALDEFDTSVTFSTDISQLLDGFLEAWKNYVANQSKSHR